MTKKQKGPAGSVGWFKKGDTTIYIIPKKGETASDAIDRVSRKHGVNRQNVKH